MILYLCIAVYVVSFVINFRLQLRRMLTWWEGGMHGYHSDDFYFFDNATPYIRAFVLAFAWPLLLPIILIWKLLTHGVKSEQQEAAERKAAEVKARNEQAEFKQKAKDLNIPGWEQL